MKAKSIYTMMLGVFLLASCNNEDTPLQAGTEPDAPAMNLPEGTFVVDYTASTDGAASRSANGMISSLDYLLYESTDGSTYTLVKNVEIPGISASTVWPLTRTNMTWAQREALKDTLKTSKSYKAVFVANAKYDLWGENVLTGVGDDANFNDARLNLPTTKPFDESNMYFMDVVEVKAPTDGNNYVNQMVLLERVINKIEVKLDEEIATDEEEVKLLVEELYDKLTTSDGVLYNYVKDCMDAIADGMSIGANAYYTENLYIVQDDIKAKTFVNNIFSNEETNSFIDYHTAFVSDITELYLSQVNWGAANKVRIKYQNNARANAIDFNEQTIPSNEEDDYLYDLTNNYSFVYYTFGNNVAGESNTLNLIDEFEFLNVQNNEETHILSISGVDFPIGEKAGSNLYAIFKCNPYGKVDTSKKKENQYSLSDFKLRLMLDWTEEHLKAGDWQTAFSLSNFEEYLNNNSSYKDNGTLESMTITFDDPLITLLPTWKVE